MLIRSLFATHKSLTKKDAAIYKDLGFTVCNKAALRSSHGCSGQAGNLVENLQNDEFS
jgi:hypothetical protein